VQPFDDPNPPRTHSTQGSLRTAKAPRKKLRKLFVRQLEMFGKAFERLLLGMFFPIA
jgi:hypothetical protein